MRHLEQLVSTRVVDYYISKLDMASKVLQEIMISMSVYLIYDTKEQNKEEHKIRYPQ
jgi:hypothetical protein